MPGNLGEYDKVILQHNNTWSHIAKPVKKYLETSDEKFCPIPRTLQMF